MTEAPTPRAGSTRLFPAVAAASGAACLLIGTLMHPMHADPNKPLAAFAEYAADRPWVLSHLVQLAGALLMLAAVASFSRLLSPGSALLTQFAAGVAAASACALQAVDGIALRNMVLAWAEADAADKPFLFAAAFGVRQIEIGMASVFALTGGIAVATFTALLWKETSFPRWLVALGLSAGLATAVGGLAMAYTGFSDLAMTINMPASIMLLVWVAAFAGYDLRRVGRGGFG